MEKAFNFHPSYEFENKYTFPVAGVDEAGIGSWVGPVVAGAVILKSGVSEEILSQLQDSKKLTHKKRASIFEALTHSEAVDVGVGSSSLEEIAELNIRQAGLLAMERAVSNLSLDPTMVLVDGTGQPQLPCPSLLIVKGDQRSYSIAAASIIAKVTRDRMLQDLAAQYPGYGWDKNAGYGTKQHRAALVQLGVSPYHRKTYAPIAALLETLP